MTILIDTLKPAPKRWVRGNDQRFCHMVSDQGGEAGAMELRTFAKKIGLKTRWLQAAGRHPHYDLTAARRELAVKEGAVQVSDRDLVKAILGAK